MNLAYSLVSKNYQSTNYVRIIGFFKHAQNYYIVFHVGYKKYIYLPFRYFKKYISDVFSINNFFILSNIYNLSDSYKYFSSLYLNEKIRFFKFFSLASANRKNELQKINSFAFLTFYKKIFFLLLFILSKKNNKNIFLLRNSRFSLFNDNLFVLKNKFIKKFSNKLIFLLNKNFLLKFFNMFVIKKKLLYFPIFLKKYFIKSKKKWIK